MNALPDTSTLPALPALLGMRGVCKRFDNVVALADVALEVHRGEVHAICGENGAGKSTLMKVLSGVHAPDDGELRIDGEPVRLEGLAHAQRLGIVMIHQELNLVPQLTVAENIWLGREPRRGWFVDRQRQRDGARACLYVDGDRLLAQLGVDERHRVGARRYDEIDLRGRSDGLSIEQDFADRQGVDVQRAATRRNLHVLAVGLILGLVSRQSGDDRDR